MSNSLPPLQIPQTSSPFQRNASNRSLPPLTGWSRQRHRPPSVASSPPSSSSPPRTPHSSNSHNHAYIRSSPAFDSESGYNPPMDYIDELPPIWHHPTHLTHTNKRPHAHVVLPGLKDIFSDAASNSRPTSLNASFIANESDRYSQARVRPKQQQPQPYHYVPVFDEEEDDEGISLEEEHFCVTRFRTSAERGQWKYDPIPFKQPQPRPPKRKSAPTCSPPPIPGLFLPSRPISEPAPSFGRPSSSPVASNSHEEETEEARFASEVISSSNPTTILSDQFSPTADDTPYSLPSLTSDRESTEPEDLVLLSSPLLPPSSPPPLSSSPSASPMMRALSAGKEDIATQSDEIDDGIDIAPTPHPAPSPLSNSEDHRQPDQVAFARACETKQDPKANVDGFSLPLPPSSGSVMEIFTPTLPRALSPIVLPPSIGVLSPTSSTAGAATHVVPSYLAPPPAAYENPEGKESDLTAPTSAMDTEASDAESGTTPPDGDVANVNLVGDGDDHGVVDIAIDDRDDDRGDDKVVVGGDDHGDVGGNMDRILSSPVGQVQDVDAEASSPFEEKLEEDRIPVSVHDTKPGVLKEKRKNRHEGSRDRPAKKLRLSEEPDEAPIAGQGVHGRKKRVRKEAQRRQAGAEGEEAEKEQAEEEEEENKPAPHPRPKKQKHETGDGSSSSGKDCRHHRSTSPSTARKTEPKSITILNSKHSLPPPTLPSSRTTSSPNHKPKHFSSKDPETEALDAEICGMLIESMASSRASCLPASTLYKNVMQSHPSLAQQRSESEWMEVIERVLRDGEGGSRRGSGVFGKVESSFKDESGRPLEARWFYVPELDEDQERAALIRSMMPRPGKRSETKKYKQYYYRPLDKISRWDPEDEM